MAFQNIAGRLVDVIFGYDFFVSYTWADGSKYAHSLHEKLKAQGFTVFLDEEEFALRWLEALRKGENPFTREEIERLRREGQSLETQQAEIDSKG